MIKIDANTEERSAKSCEKSIYFDRVSMCIALYRLRPKAGQFGGGRQAYVHDALSNLIYGIVLWDDITVSMNPFYASNAFIATVKLLAHNNIKFTQLDYAFDSEKQDILKMLPEFDKHKRERLANSITNMIIANKTGADYLPSIETQSMLQMSGMKNAFTRFVVLDSLDMQLSNFYKELNCLLGQDIVSYPFPVLLDYLAKKYSNASDILKAAFELREEKRVISLRCELNELDRAFISGDLLAVRDE